jgi:prepilin-type processing-associated H-X9-DG protein
MGASEVKGWTSYYRNAGLEEEDLPEEAFSPVDGTPLIIDPVSGAEVKNLDVCSLGASSTTREFKKGTGHTEWVDGRAHQVGFTTVFPPNAKVRCTESGVVYDVDWTNWQEGKNWADADKTNDSTVRAAVTARSYHKGSVNVLMMDGSVRSMSEQIDLGTWRAISTRASGEKLSADFNK